MNFSLILPTRKRVSLLHSLCRSIHECTDDKSNIEMFAVGDTDDTDTITAFRELSNYQWFRGHMRERGDNISRDYQNWIYRLTRGKYIFVINDDVEIKTLNWDTIALRKIENYLKLNPDGIFYGWTADSENVRIRNERDAYACFPILSRTAIDILGYVMHEHYGGWSADVYLYNVYKEIDRILDLSEILVKHYSHWVGNRERDETSESMRCKSTNINIIDHKPDAEKLRKHFQYPKILL